MTPLEVVAEQLGVVAPWIERGGAYWLDPGNLNPRQLAAQMHLLRARFVTITAYELPAHEGFRLEYHWDLDGRLLGFPVRISGTSIESIADLCEAADWIEREIHEEYNIDFIGRKYEPLLLREGDRLGVNLRDADGAVKASGVQARQEVAK